MNNAAVVRHRPIAEWTTDGFDEHFATNVRAPYFLIQAALPDLLRLAGQIRGQHQLLVRLAAADRPVGVRDDQGGPRLPDPDLAGELAPAGVRVNCIAPGPIDTPIHATWADDLDEAYRWLAEQVPLGRIGTADEVARWIALLLSPFAVFLTGAVIPLDGGQVLHRD